MAPLSDQRLDLGGRGLHVVAAGQGEPTVVLEAGGGCPAEIWREVQERVGDVTATYSYDRAGHGTSDPAGPWSLAAWVADLEHWLAMLAGPPYVLVGHSIGAHVVRAFAARHRGEVTGLVLVDARHELLESELREFADRLAALAPDDTQRATAADQVVGSFPDLIDLPLTVITHDRVDWIPDVLELTPSEAERCEEAWQRYQRRLADTSAPSTLRVAAGAGHMIPVERPDLVADEIIALVRQSRPDP